MRQYPVPWITVVLRNEDGLVCLPPGMALAGGTSWQDGVRACTVAVGVTALGERCLGLYVDGEKACASFLVDDFMGTLKGAEWVEVDALPSPDRERVREWLESPR